MTIEMNLDGVEAWKGGAILPPGSYNCTIASAEEGTSKGGHPQIEVKLEALDGDYAGGTITDWIVITEGSMGRVRQLLEAGDFQIPEGNFALAASDLAGLKVRILVREEPKNDGSGDMRSRVKAYEPVGEAVAASSNGRDKDDDLPF